MRPGLFLAIAVVACAADFNMRQAFINSDGAVFVGDDSSRQIAIDYKPGRNPEYRIMGDAEAAPWLARVPALEQWITDRFTPISFGPGSTFRLVQQENQAGRSGRATHLRWIEDRQGMIYTLPQSSYDEFAKTRPPRVKNNYLRENTVFEEDIGPAQAEGDKLWFGKVFYDGEGNSGIGGVGYFDATDRQFRIFSPPELAPYSVSAILVVHDDVWMGTFSFAEEPGAVDTGLVRFDRRTHTARRYPLPDAVNSLIGVGDRILAATSSGIAVLQGGRIRRFSVEVTADGRLRIAEAVR